MSQPLVLNKSTPSVVGGKNQTRHCSLYKIAQNCGRSYFLRRLVSACGTNNELNRPLRPPRTASSSVKDQCFG